ncbi:MAG: DUF4388 domain-containing protein, partial [Myxococcota bacterium]
RASLLATILGREGLPADPYWTQSTAALLCEQRLEALAHANGFHGTLHAWRPMALLQLIRDRALVGSLELFDPVQAYRIVLQGDTLRSLEPRQVNPELLLGHMLVARGWLEVEPLQMAVAAQDADHEGRRPLGAYLVERGHVTPEQLEEVLQSQAQSYLIQICNMHQGTFIFREEQPGHDLQFGPFKPSLLGMSTSRLLLEILRDAEVEHSGVRLVDRAYEPFEDAASTRMVLNPIALGSLDMEMFTPTERTVLERFTVPKEVDSLSQLEGFTDTETASIVRRLHRLGFLERS